MKNAVLAILGVFVFSSAFACSGNAPPVTVQTELTFKAPALAFVDECVIVDTQVSPAPQFLVTKPIVLTSVTLFPSTRSGFVYRNVDYESCSDYICAGSFRNHKNVTVSISNPCEPKLPDIIKKNGPHDRCFV